MYFQQKHGGVILHDGNFDGRKLDHTIVVLSEEECFPYSSSSEENQLQI